MNGKVVGSYETVTYDPNYVLIFSREPAVYYKIQDSSVIKGSSLDNLSTQYANGQWVVKPPSPIPFNNTILNGNLILRNSRNFSFKFLY